MRVRKKLWPKTIGDFMSMLFLLIIVPLIYWFELWIVLPELYTPGTSAYYLHFCFGTFIMINIVGNITFTFLSDTSSEGVLIPSPEQNAENGWRFCSVCVEVHPPRSWHCNTCKTCILKRDHHCIFTGCCIGHFNQRYFLMFILYIFIGALYSLIYNNHFIWNRIEFEFPISIIKIMFPLAIFVFGFDDSIEHFYLMLYIVTIVGMLFSANLCIYHFNSVLLGCTANEKNKGIYKYSFSYIDNIKEVFGERWYLTWILPYVHSKLPHNGTDFEANPNVISNRKNR
ncbi:probable palmitoyltransferase ZDHHC24 [Trichogramma pretiosum]|uniref:probable palmitoyltransferase ZDHHC24 n=1 Tax=Trichogramma pretiosum TaxID=7493 RepID=UPI0006C94355|nr:probable palmitoyltransferase ZDHHC24 [Trichogramma pretiosum]